MTAVWPPISPQDLHREEATSLARELEWLLASLQETLASLKLGLAECAALLSPDQGTCTLVLSSQRSENLKGYVTRVGTRVVKGDINLRLISHPPPRGSPSLKLSISSAPQSPTLVLAQLTTVRTLINACLDVIDVSVWTGDAKNANFIAGQLQLLFDNFQEAKHALTGGASIQKLWCEDTIDPHIFNPPLPRNISFNLFIAEAALVLEIRTLEPATTPSSESLTGFGLRDRIAIVLGAAKIQPHDEVSEVFTFKGEQVRVREKVRVESQDPNLLAALAKLGALEHVVARSRRALDIVMGKED